MERESKGTRIMDMRKREDRRVKKNLLSGEDTMLRFCTRLQNSIQSCMIKFTFPRRPHNKSASTV